MQKYSLILIYGKKWFKKQNNETFFFITLMPFHFFFLSLPCRQDALQSKVVRAQALSSVHPFAQYNTKPFFNMPNKRDLKRTIQTICDDVFAECIAISLYEGGVHEENVESLLTSIIVTRNDFVSRISHPEPGMSQKKFYDKLAHDFAERISEIIDQMGYLTKPKQ